MADILRRSFAPIPNVAWQEIDEEAGRTLKTYLAARHVADFDGPHGWEVAAVNLGRVDYDKKQNVDGVGWAQRQVMPLVEIRVPFSLPQFELDNIARGCDDADLHPLEEAAKKTALFEEQAVFNGFAPGGISGIKQTSDHDPVKVPGDIQDFPGAVAEAVEMLRNAGVAGPYAMALEPDLYHKLAQSTKTGYPLRRVVSQFIEGGLYWSQALTGGVVLSQRGGDFELTVGQDLSIGYESHDSQSVNLYFTESFAYRTLEPRATVSLES